jgi:hypothetical protein
VPHGGEKQWLVCGMSLHIIIEPAPYTFKSPFSSRPRLLGPKPDEAGDEKERLSKGCRRNVRSTVCRVTTRMYPGTKLLDMPTSCVTRPDCSFEDCSFRASVVPCIPFQLRQPFFRDFETTGTRYMLSRCTLY